MSVEKHVPATHVHVNADEDVDPATLHALAEIAAHIAAEQGMGPSACKPSGSGRRATAALDQGDKT